MLKLVVFAHTPPPHHGQSYMVQLLLEGLRGPAGAGIEWYHVDARFSDDLEDIGVFRSEKVLLLLRYCAQAIWHRLRDGADVFYYVPAPGKRAALYRDWLIMLLCRPFFRQVVHHWHAVGLGDWLQKEGSWLERRLTHWLLGKPTLGIALAIPGMRDALWFRSEWVETVPNGIPDPCPDFETAVLPRRQTRLAARRQLLAGQLGEPQVFQVLYLAHCTAAKGLFDTLEGVALANEHLRSNRSPLSIHLTVAGEFLHDEERDQFHARLAEINAVAVSVTYAGFVSGERKAALLRESDALCFPTYYSAESFGLVVVEAMAAGMAVIASAWRALPEILPPPPYGYVPIRKPAAVAEALLAALAVDGTPLRAEFLSRFTEASHLAQICQALRSLEQNSNNK